MVYNSFTKKHYKTRVKQTMIHHNTVIAQLLKLIPRHEFDTLENQHHTGRSFRKASRWSQFVTMMVAQLSARNSLRDIVDNMAAQIHKLYHLGTGKLSRTTLSRINEDKPYQLYEALLVYSLAAKRLLQRITFALNINCIRLMLPPSTSVYRPVYRPFHGQNFAHQKEP